MLKASVTIYSLKPLGLERVHTYPLKSRQSKVSVADFAKPIARGASIDRWIDSLPRILAADNFRGAVAALERAKAKQKPIIWGMGGHVIKVGLAPVLIDLMRRGYVSAIAMNGSAMIHDFEIGLAGATSEDVPEALGAGRFGMAEETGRIINENIARGAKAGVGIGESVGAYLARARGVPFRKYSVLAAAYQKKIPVTVHVAIGTDIVHHHPAVDPAAIGAATHRDFLLLAALVKAMDGGGVYLNVGSAVILPEVFLKCVGVAANAGGAPRGITTVNMDFIQHYRPTQNVILRPTAAHNANTRLRSRGLALTGHHEIMVPLLAAALGRGARAGSPPGATLASRSRR